MNNFEREEERIRNLFDSVSSEIERDNEVRDSSSDEEDHVSASEHETDSDQEAESGTENDSEDTSGEDDIPLSTRLDVLFGKNGTQWKKNPSTQNVRTRSVNIVSHLPGVKQAAKNAKTLIDAFFIIF
uniref:Uncharacterized protein n=1 Tax=Clastoptera arizonana TaxID=38151 RepID=A0A1B6CP87_9HEMI